MVGGALSDSVGGVARAGSLEAGSRFPGSIRMGSVRAMVSAGTSVSVIASIVVAGAEL